MQSFLETMEKPKLSKSAEWFDAVWETEPRWVRMRPWMSIIERQFLEPLLHKVLTELENLLSMCTGEGAYKNYDMVVPWKNAAWSDV